MKISEKAIEKQIIQYLRARKIWCTKIDNTGIFDPTRKVFRRQSGTYKIKGLPDIIALHQSKFFAFEVKSETGRPSLEQKRVLAEINELGGYAGIVRSIDDVVALLALGGVKLYPA